MAASSRRCRRVVVVVDVDEESCVCGSCCTVSCIKLSLPFVVQFSVTVLFALLLHSLVAPVKAEDVVGVSE